MKKIFFLYCILAICLNFAQSAMSQVIYTQDFEGALGANGLPTGLSESGSSTLKWEVGTTATAASASVPFPAHTNFAYINDEICNCNMTNERMVLPAQNLTGFNGYNLKFDVYAVQNGALWDVLVSSNAGTSWDTIHHEESNMPTWEWETKVLDLSYYAGQNILVAIEYRDQNFATGGLGIDNISIERRPDHEMALGVAAKEPNVNLNVTFMHITGFQNMPVSQIKKSELFFGSSFANQGSFPSSNAHIRLNIRREIAPNNYSLVYTDTINFGTIDRDSIAFRAKTMNDSTWCIPGKYQYEYIAMHANLDEQPANDSIRGSFNLTTGLWSKVNVAPDGGPLGDSAYIVPGTVTDFLTQMEWGTIFYMPRGDIYNLEAISVRLHSSSTATSPTAVYTCRIFEVQDNGDGIFEHSSDLSLVALTQLDTVVVTPGASYLRELTNFIDINTFGPFQFSANKAYYISINQSNQISPGLNNGIIQNGLSMYGQTINHDAFYRVPNSSYSQYNPLKVTNNLSSYMSYGHGWFQGPEPSIQLNFGTRLISGSVYNDYNQDCIRNTTEGGLSRIVVIQPGNLTLSTNTRGYWNLDSLPVGTYTITVDTSNTNWLLTCPPTQTFTVVHPDSIVDAPDFGFMSRYPCPALGVSIGMQRMRRGFSNQPINISACNSNAGSTYLDSAYVIVELDPNVSVQSASHAYTALGNNQFRFDIGTLNVGDCVDITMSSTVNLSAIAGQTLCISAELYPQPSCVFDTMPEQSFSSYGISPCTSAWDSSHLDVEVSCVADSVRFVIYNTGLPGSGDMDCFAPVLIASMGTMAHINILDSVQLAGGDSMVYMFLGNAQTWHLEVLQHPLHPGNSRPSAFIENCGSGTWMPGLINMWSQDDLDPIIDIACYRVDAPYDPNDKTGFPLGVDSTHNIAQNQPIEYLIRFQNVGTDTAFNIVVRDTLSEDLNIFSVRSGASSDPYEFSMQGPRVLEWRFNNIMLPDSNVNEPGSHGFVKFTVNQNTNLPFGTRIENTAAIYFDFEAPVITNTYFHTVADFSIELNTIPLEAVENKTTVKVIPNPFSQSATIIAEGLENTENLELEVYNLTGQRLFVASVLNNGQFNIDSGDLPSGLYFFNIRQQAKVVAAGKMVVSK